VAKTAAKALAGKANPMRGVSPGKMMDWSAFEREVASTPMMVSLKDR
jgi:hypothetical protein